MIFAYFNVSEWLMFVCIGGILLCWLIEVTAAFRNNAPGLGFFSLVFPPIAPLIIGCIYAREWKIGQVMIICISFVVGLFITLLYTMYRAAEKLN